VRTAEAALYTQRRDAIVRLPRHPGTQTSKLAPDPRAWPSDGPRGHVREETATEQPILIVDADAGVRGSVASVLKQAGYRTSEAASGEAALEAVRDERPRLVVVEVHLPGVSGYEVCRELRDGFGEGLPIMFVSGDRTESFDRVAGLLIGADDYLVKPFAFDELVARVRALLRRSEATPPSHASTLTSRELEVLRLLSEGLGQGEIASRLVVSPKTVGTHIEHIFKKLGVHSRAEAVAAAYREELLVASS
jgi:DNA-binding NarL/FixJ family response regulator